MREYPSSWLPLPSLQEKVPYLNYYLTYCYDSSAGFCCNLDLSLCSGGSGRNAAKVVLYEDVGKKQVLHFTAALRGCRSMLQAVTHFDSCVSKLTSSRLRDLLTIGT